MASVYFVGILPALSKHYRVVMVDNLAWGLNQRTLEAGDALESPEKAEAWTLEWWQRIVEALDLPPKFYLSGHSAGGTQLMLYASAFPERIEGMFLQSPGAAEDQSVEGFVYDPYTIRTDSEDKMKSKAEVDHFLSMFENNVHMQTDMRKVP